jgi:hypothetical protein
MLSRKRTVLLFFLTWCLITIFHPSLPPFLQSSLTNKEKRIEEEAVRTGSLEVTREAMQDRIDHMHEEIQITSDQVFPLNIYMMKKFNLLCVCDHNYKKCIINLPLPPPVFFHLLCFMFNLFVYVYNVRLFSQESHWRVK